MTYRYKNFYFNDSSSLLTLVQAVVMCPMKAVYECMEPEKLGMLALTMGPLLGLPLLTRRYERYILLIPYLLMMPSLMMCRLLCCCRKLLRQMPELQLNQPVLTFLISYLLSSKSSLISKNALYSF